MHIGHWHRWVMFVALFVPGISYAQITIPTHGCHMESFDSPGHGWTLGTISGTSSWTIDSPNKAAINDDQTGGGECILLGGNTPSSTYNFNENSWAMSPEYDLTTTSSPYLEFWFYWANESSTSFDEIWMEYSLDGGVTWLIVSPPIGTDNCYDQNWYNFTDNWGGAETTACWGGGIGPSGWVLTRKCIADLGGEPSVFFRFRISTGTVCEHFGAAVDNFSICEAHLEAKAEYSCHEGLEVSFIDLTTACPDGWLWDFGDGMTSTQQHPVHTYALPGTYAVSLTTTSSLAVSADCGGPFTDRMSFEIELLEASITQTDILCHGAGDGAAAITVTGASMPPFVSWSPAPGIGDGTLNGEMMNPGLYSITITPVTEGCGVISTIVIAEPPPLLLEGESTLTGCASTEGIATLFVSGGTPPYTYLWDDEFSQTTPVTTAVPLGDYTATVTDEHGCQSSMLIPITASEEVSAEFTSSPLAGQITTNPASISFVNTSVNAISWIWDFGDGTMDTLLNPSHTYTAPGEYCVRLIAIDEAGCSDEISACYEVLPPKLFVPNSFTPNGDGLNDQFEIIGVQFFEGMYFAVYNRWGMLVFESNGYANEWNGTDTRGKSLPEGSYVYLLRPGRDLSGNQWNPLKGSLLILR